MLLHILQNTAGAFFFFAAIALILVLVIFFTIIRSATRSTSVRDHLKIQTDILKEIALKQGVSEETIKSVVNKHIPGALP